MKRVVMPEWLDEMGAQEKEAVRSRRDLQRLNFWLGHARLMGCPLASLRASAEQARIAELGAGDATYMLRLARRLSRRRVAGKAVLVDRRPSVSPGTCAELERSGWTVEVVEADVFDWLPGAIPADALVANLFLHHFAEQPLARLLALAAGKCSLFVACEPRRAALPLTASRLLWLLGCNAVTRHDAPISVRAGFSGRELSTLWPAAGWSLRERRAGLFSHFFVAKKIEIPG
jgi:hypothetical protein